MENRGRSAEAIAQQGCMFRPQLFVLMSLQQNLQFAYALLLQQSLQCAQALGAESQLGMERRGRGVGCLVAKERLQFASFPYAASQPGMECRARNVAAPVVKQRNLHFAQQSVVASPHGMGCLGRSAWQIVAK